MSNALGRLDVSGALKNPGQLFPFEAEIGLDEMEVLNDPVHFVDIRIAGNVLYTQGSRISLKAEVTSQADTRCSRCLEPVRVPVKAVVDAQFDRTPDPGDPDLYGYEASTIELTDAVRDALLLELPLRVLCSEDCKGLCPVCGINLNRETCTCQEGAEVTNPFSALKNIVLDNEEV